MFTIISIILASLLIAVLVPILKIIFKIFGFIFKTYVLLLFAGAIVLIPLFIIFWLI